MDFQSRKSFGKLRHRAFQQYHQIMCILKHVGDGGAILSTPMGCNAMYVRDIGNHNTLQYTFNGWKALSVSSPKLFSDWKSIDY